KVRTGEVLLIPEGPFRIEPGSVSRKEPAAARLALVSGHVQDAEQRHQNASPLRQASLGGGAVRTGAGLLDGVPALALPSLSSLVTVLVHYREDTGLSGLRAK